MKLLSLLLLIPQMAAADAYVSVRGEGEIKISPDIATISLQVNSKAKDAKSAQALNAREMARVQKTLKSDFGISENNIQTSGFSVNPEYRYEQNGKQTFIGYSVSHSLSVKVKKLDQLGSLLDKLVGKGSEELAVLLSHVQFDTEKRQEAEIRAMELAMGNARSRAEALAKFAKRSLKGVRRISDSSVQHSAPPFDMAMAGQAKMMEAAPPTQVSAGEISVSSQVSVDYELD